MVNTMVKALDGDTMDDNLIIRIDKVIKERFKEAAEKQNPQLPRNKAVSIVIRQMMLDYIDRYFESKEGGEK